MRKQFWSTMLAFLFTDIFEKTRNYVCETSTKYNYDRSHNIIHSMDVLKFTHMIMDNHPSAIPNVRDEVYVTGMLHDMIDRKYRDPEDAYKDVNDFILNELNFSPEQASFMMLSMSTMSHSKTVIDDRFKEPEWVMDPWTPSKYVFLWHCVRQADLLASYDIERMLSYKYYKVDNCIQNVIDDTLKTYENRILKLRSIPRLFPSFWAKQESARLEIKSNELIEKLKSERRNITDPKQFQKFRLLGDYKNVVF